MTTSPHQNGSEILLYKTDDGELRVQVRMEDETVWLSQRQMGELFRKDIRTISEHIRNLYDEGELEHGATIRNFRTVQAEGDREVEREIDLYNLDVIVRNGSKHVSLCHHRANGSRNYCGECGCD